MQKQWLWAVVFLAMFLGMIETTSGVLVPRKTDFPRSMTFPSAVPLRMLAGKTNSEHASIKHWESGPQAHKQMANDQPTSHSSGPTKQINTALKNLSGTLAAGVVHPLQHDTRGENDNTSMQQIQQQQQQSQQALPMNQLQRIQIPSTLPNNIRNTFQNTPQNPSLNPPIQNAFTMPRSLSATSTTQTSTTVGLAAQANLKSTNELQYTKEDLKNIEVSKNLAVDGTATIRIRIPPPSGCMSPTQATASDLVGPLAPGAASNRNTERNKVDTADATAPAQQPQQNGKVAEANQRVNEKVNQGANDAVAAASGPSKPLPQTTTDIPPEDRTAPADQMRRQRSKALARLRAANSLSASASPSPSPSPPHPNVWTDEDQPGRKLRSLQDEELIQQRFV